MDITRCRHTFAQERVFTPWKRCSYCLDNISPFAMARRCTTCQTVVHAHCYYRILDQLHRVAVIMEGQETPAELVHTVGEPPYPTMARTPQPTDTTRSSSVAPASSTPSACPSAASAASSLQVQTVVSAMSSYKTFAEYVAAQKRCLLPAIESALKKSSPSPTGTTNTQSSATADDVNARESGGTEGASWWSAMFSSTANAASSTAASATTARGADGSDHVHSLQPFNVYVPFHKCVVCARRGSAATARASNRANAKRGHPDGCDDDGEDDAVEMTNVPVTESLAASPTGPDSDAFRTHYDPVQKLLRDGGWIGLGMDAYRCTTCADSFELHCDCLRAMSQASYTLQAPPARRLHGSDADGEGQTKRKARTGDVSDDAAQTATEPSSTEVAIALASKALPDWVKLLLHAYLTASSRKAKSKVRAGDADGGEEDGSDGNVDRILDSIYAYMGLILEEFPNLGAQLLNPIRMRQISREHEALYDVCCSTLPDADIFGSTAAAHSTPPSTDPSLAVRSPASASPVSNDASSSPRVHPGQAPCTSLSLQQHPTTLFLRDTMRFAMAVYGECYRDGSLSSLFSATLLFTTNKEDVYNMPKETNDKAVTDVLTLPRSALKLSRWTTHAGEASYALLLDHGSRRIVVAFRGTLSEADILTDICAFGEPFCGGVAHQGAARAVNALFDHRLSRVNAAKAAETTPKPAVAATTTTAEVTAPATGEAETVIVVSESGGRAASWSDVEASPHTPEQHCATSPSARAHPTAATAKSDATTVLSPIAVLHESGFSAPRLADRRGAEPDALLDMLEDYALNKFPTYDVVITGHSLGAGQAILFGVRLVYDEILPADVLSTRVYVVGFAPMPTLSRPAAALCDAPHPTAAQTMSPIAPTPTSPPAAPPLAAMWSIVNACDVVPRLQINSLNRLCALLCGNEKASSPATVPLKKSEGEEDEEAAACLSLSPSPSSPAEASHVKAADEKNSLDLMPELHHPGRVFVFTHPGDPQRNRLIEIPRSHVLTHEIFITPAMLTAHLIDSYMNAMRYVRTREMPTLLPNPSPARDPTPSQPTPPSLTVADSDEL